MVLLSDVDATTHCFSLSPEPCDGSDALPSDPSETGGEQVATYGSLDMHGPAGTVVILALHTLHTATVRVTTKERKTLQTYYGHQGGQTLSQFTSLPPVFWRDHIDQDCRIFYSGLPLNAKSRALLAAPAGAEVPQNQRQLSAAEADTASRQRQFAEEGWLVIDGVLPFADVEALRAVLEEPAFADAHSADEYTAGLLTQGVPGSHRTPFAPR